MTKNEELLLFNKRSYEREKLHKKLLINLKTNIFKIIRKFNAYLKHGCDDYKNFTGKDIDAFYEKNNKCVSLTFKNTIRRNLSKNDLRLHINDPKSVDFLSLDIEDSSNIPKPIFNIYKTYFNKRMFCKKTRLNHLDRKSIIFYKLYKYFRISIRSFDQLKILKKEIRKLNKDEFLLINKSVEKAMPREYEIIEKFLNWKFVKFINNKNVKNFFLTLKFKRQKKRAILAGNIHSKKIFFSKKFIYAFIFGQSAKWNFNHTPMPAIAIIGNDGSGKTTFVEYIRENFYKMDPLIINMKSSVPFFRLTMYLREKIKKILKYNIIKRNNFFKLIISYIGEFCGLIDKYFKYKIGMAWADSGYGLTIFERYPTDRIRGEFPNRQSKIFPLEQFFPFPDGMVYLDVIAKDSVKRKLKDNHTLAEMNSKRKNYLNLIKEFDEVEKISHSKNIKEKIRLIKNYIFRIYIKKNKQIKLGNKIRRIHWKKNYKRVIAGANLKRHQKDSFFNGSN